MMAMLSKQDPESVVQRNPASAFKPQPQMVSEKVSTRTSAPMSSEDQELADTFRQRIQEREGGIKGMQKQLDTLQSTETPWEDRIDFKPLAALTDTWMGTNMASQIQAPQAEAKRQAAIAKLQDAIAKNEGAVADDQLAYLKGRSQDQKDIARENRMMTAMGLRGGRQGQADEFRLREKWDAHPITKATQSMGDHFSRITAVDSNTPAGQMSMIFAYMKMLDDGSVVRESEYAQAAKTAGMADRAQTYLASLKTGQKLSPTQIREFQESARQIMAEVEKKQGDLDNDTKELAQSYGLNPDRVVYRSAGGKKMSQAPSAGGKPMSPDEFFAQKKGTY